MSEIQNSSIFSLDDVNEEEMNNLIDGTITDFDEGDLVNGTVVKIEHDEVDRKSTRLNSSHRSQSRMPSSA